MKWFKRIFSKITMDDIEMEEETQGSIERKQPEQERKQSEQLEIKTRMTYTYPQRQFRFPVIQDRPSARPNLKDRIHNNKEQTEQPGVEEKNEQKRKAYKNQEAPRVSRKVESKIRQPFKPTHIPSPIYGFQRPEKADADSLDQKEDPIFNMGQVDDKYPHVSDSIEVGEQQETYIKTEHEAVREDQDERNHNVNEDTEKEFVNQFEPSEDDNFVQADQENEKEEHVIAKVLEPIKADDLLDEEIILDEEHVSVNDLDSSEADDLVDNENEPVQDTEEQEWNSVEEHKDDMVGTVYESTPILEEEEEQVEGPSNQLNEQDVTVREKPRKHVPFNVLMLKQDRKKLEENKQKKMQAQQFQVRQAEQETLEQQTNQAGQPQDMKEAAKEVSVALETSKYQFPVLDLLQPPIMKSENKEWLDEQTALLDETLRNFNVEASVVKVSQGPSVTRFEVQPDRGVKVSKIRNLTDDIKLSMAAKDIRMEAPIPGKRSIGIELPNMESRPVQISEIIGADTFTNHESPLTAALGLDISGIPVVTDISRMPHGLIAGATGSGKSVCINSILVSLLYKARPDELKLLLIDPKMVELTPYNEIPHLVSPVITDVKAATAALKWAVDEMERRYELFAHTSVRDIKRFNELAEKSGNYADKLPFIVVVIDELADLMMMAPADVEESICRIAQKARACGIHLLIATQRPSVDVITGLIKANVPARIAFSVSSQVDSRTIIDISGAEKLLGRGDMLFLDSGTSKPVRLQGTFVSDDEIDRVIAHARSQGKPNYLFEQEELLKKAQIQEDEDELFMDACDFVVAQGSASTSLLQRQFRIGYNRASRLILMMEERGIISEARGSKARDVLIGERELEQLT